MMNSFVRDIRAAIYKENCDIGPKTQERKTDLYTRKATCFFPAICNKREICK